jgi:hypothetical protein
MSGISTRTPYDSNYLNEYINQETGPGAYRINDIYSENINKCVSNLGPRQNSHLTNTEIPTINIEYRKDVENYLLNLDLPTSRSMQLNTLNEKNYKLDNFFKNKNLSIRECNNFLNPQYTRLEQNVLDNRSIFINRFDHPIIDPKSTVYYGVPSTEQVGNNRFGVNTRLQAKDNYTKL